VAVLVALDDDEGHPREWRLYGGSPAGALERRLRVRWRARPFWAPVELDVDGSRTLLVELRLPRLSGWRMRVLSPAVERVPWRGALLPPVALAGDHVAFVGSTRRERAAAYDGVFVVDRRSAAVEASIKLSSVYADIREDDLDLRPDGRVVAAVDGRLLTVAPGEPRSVLGGDAAHPLSAPRFAGDRLVALAGDGFEIQRPVVLDPGAATPRVVGTPSTALEALAANEHGLAWLANGCVMFATLDAATPAETPAGPCPRAEVTLEEGDQVLRGRTVRILVGCVTAPAAGCRGTVQLRDGRIVGRGRFVVPAGRRRTVEVVLTRVGLSRVRRALRREGSAFLALGARVRDGRVSIPGGQSGAVIDRVAQ
jgi:hypothetical protein